MKLSVVMPVYNERATLRCIAERVLSVATTELELICVDDGSRDSTAEIVRNLAAQDRCIKLIELKENCGRGYASARRKTSTTRSWSLASICVKKGKASVRPAVSSATGHKPFAKL